jgi:hypothetical protein
MITDYALGPIAFLPKLDSITIPSEFFFGTRHVMKKIQLSSLESSNLMPLIHLQYLEITQMRWVAGRDDGFYQDNFQDCFGPLRHFHHLKEIRFINNPRPVDVIEKGLTAAVLKMIMDFFIQMRENDAQCPIPMLKLFGRRQPGDYRDSMLASLEPNPEDFDSGND